MHITTNTTIRAAGHESGSAQKDFGDISLRLAGAGAILFVVTVIAQNLVRGAAAPANDANSQEVLTYYADHRAITFLLVGTFVLTGFGLAAFVGGAMRRMLACDRRAWAFTGFAGSIGIISLFAVLIGAEEALSVASVRAEPSLAAIEALWVFHNGVFSVLILVIAVALLGLSRAGVSAGITPTVFEKLGPVGAGLLSIAALAGPAIAAGDAMPLFGLGLLGFIVWLAFLGATGLRLLRASN